MLLRCYAEECDNLRVAKRELEKVLEHERSQTAALLLHPRHAPKSMVCALQGSKSFALACLGATGPTFRVLHSATAKKPMQMCKCAPAGSIGHQRYIMYHFTFPCICNASRNIKMQACWAYARFRNCQSKCLHSCCTSVASSGAPSLRTVGCMCMQSTLCIASQRRGVLLVIILPFHLHTHCHNNSGSPSFERNGGVDQPGDRTTAGGQTAPTWVEQQVQATPYIDVQRR